jgi:hypothetical protein
MPSHRSQPRAAASDPLSAAVSWRVAVEAAEAIHPEISPPPWVNALFTSADNEFRSTASRRGETGEGHDVD